MGLQTFKSVLCLILGFGLLVNCQKGIIAKANYKLTGHLLKTLNSENNVVFSPSSLLNGLGMVFTGLGIDSKKIVGQALGFSPSDDVAKSFRDIYKVGKSPSKESINFIVVGEQYGIKDQYAKQLRNYFNASPFIWDFQENPEEARKRINAKVRNNTNGQIQMLYEPGSLSEETKVVLVNVLHFKSDWTSEFSNTYNGNFSAYGQESITVPMMQDFFDVRYVKTENDVEIVAVPFEDKNYEMVFILPPKDQDMKTYVDTELQPHLLKVLEMADSEKVFASIAMPKLTLKSRSQMKEPLSKLPGLGHIFSDSVDLSRMAREKIKVEGVT